MQKLKLIFDSGSSWLWVQTTGCSTSQSTSCTASKVTYDPSASEFYDSNVDGENTHSIKYGQGEIKGTIFKDRVCLDADANRCVTDYAVLGATWAKDLSNVKASGLVGMSPKNFESKADSPLFIDLMYESGEIPSRMFSLYLTDYFSTPDDASGSKIIIGGYSLDKYAKEGFDVTWNSLVNQYYWSVKLVSVKVNDTQGTGGTSDLATRSSIAIVDSGTSYLLMPVEDFSRLLTVLNGAYGMSFAKRGSSSLYTSPCFYSTYQSLPDLQI